MRFDREDGPLTPGGRAFSRSSKGRLTARDLARFPSQSLFDRLGRAVCEAGCLPRKELYEAWEVARRARRLFRGRRVVDLAGGHGLLAHIMLILDDCGDLTDRILARAISARVPVAVLPCCQDLAACDAGPLRGWIDGALAVDVMRAVRLEEQGYQVRTQTIPGAITPKNRLLFGQPRPADYERPMR